MDQKTTGIIAYLTWIGLIIALVLNKDKSEYVRFHMRQSLGLFLMFTLSSILCVMPLLGAIIWVGILVFWVIAFVGAINGEMKPIPVLGDKFQAWFKSL